MATGSTTNNQKWSQRPGTLTLQETDKILLLRSNAGSQSAKNPTASLAALRTFIQAGAPLPQSVAPFNPTGPDLNQNDRVLYEVNGRTLQYAVRPAGGLKKADFGGSLPAPSPVGSDTNYLFIPFGTDALNSIIDTNNAQLALDQEMGRLSYPRIYRVLRVRAEGDPVFGDVVFIPLPDIYIWALGPDLLNTQDVVQVDNGEVSTGRYDIGTDTFTSGGDSFVRIVGDPDDGNLIIGSPDLNATITSGQFNLINNAASSSIDDGNYNLLQGGNSNLIQKGAQNSIYNGDNNLIEGGSNNAIFGGTSNVIPDTCGAVTLINCESFTVPAGTSNKTYINNVDVASTVYAQDVEITDPSKGVIMAVGSTRVRARITGSSGAYTWNFTEL